MIKFIDPNKQANNLLNKNRAGLMQHSIGQSPISLMRESNVFTRITTAVSLLFFLSTFYIVPTAQAVDETFQAERAKKEFHPQGRTDEEKLSNTLQAIKEHVTEKKTALDKRVAEESSLWQDFLNVFGLSGLLAEDLDKLASMTEQAESLHQKALQGFVEVEQELKAKNLPESILQRHTETVEKYQVEYQRFLEKLQQAQAAESLQDQDDALGELDGFLGEQQFRRSQQPFDPENLPNQYLKPDEHNVPDADGSMYRSSEFLRSSKPFVQEFADTILSGIVGGEAYAAPGDFVFDELPGAADSVLLDETTEIIFSDAIVNKAAELGHDPVKIYHWVRNNIEWQPSWGATQSSDLTLDTSNGNAIDTASLLIALLRVSGIPARYAHGVIEVPADQFRNWAGGFENINAAMQFASSSGIPVTSIVSGGQISKVRLEHIWVEAAIDYFPSRGAKNRVADSWISLDPSFKQYEYIQGIDESAIITTEPNEIIDELLASGTVNEQEGWIAGLDQSIIENAQSGVEQMLDTYIENNLPDATVLDVIGGRRTIVQEFPTLPSALPYHMIMTGQRYAELPGNLQQKITFAFGSDILGDLSNPTTLPWAMLNNEKITLSFRPATAADEQTLLSYLPEGEITDISQLPTSIPAYLISVIPELKLNGEVIKTGGAMKLGEELTFSFNPTILGQGTIPKRYNVIAGSYLDIAVISGRVSIEKLRQLQQTVEETSNILSGQDAELIAGVTREELLGDLFYAGVMAYYGQYTSLANVLGLKQSASHYLSAGLGSFGYEPEVDTFFGFPRAIKNGGIGLNIPIIQATSVDGNSQDLYQSYNLQIGILSSALEHAVPEQMFVNDQNPGEAISAVKAIQKAMNAGQRIYHITAANQAEVLPNIRHDGATMNEIRQAISGGKQVITHTNTVSVPGWSGAGYIIYDPDTGSGAYKIAGGANGGFFFALAVTIIAFLVAIAILQTSLLLGLFLLGWELMNFINWIDAIENADSFDEFNKANFSQAIVSLLALIAPFFEAAAAFITIIFGVVFSWMLTSVL
jgi:hypothetical protein